MISRSLGPLSSLAIKQPNTTTFSSRPASYLAPSQKTFSPELKSGLSWWSIKPVQIQPKQPSQAEKSFLEKYWNKKNVLLPRRPSARTVSESVYRVEDASLGCVTSSILSVLGYIPIIGCVAAGISMLTHGPYSYLRSENTKLDKVIKKADTLHFLSSIPVFITKTIQLFSPIEVAMSVSFQLFSIFGAIKSTLELIKNGRVIFNAYKIKNDLQNSQIDQKDKEYLIRKLSNKQKIESFKAVGNTCLLVGSILMLIPFCQIPSLVFLIVGSGIRCGVALQQYQKLNVKNKKIPFIKEELTLRHRMDIQATQKETSIDDAIHVTKQRLDKLNQRFLGTRYQTLSERLTLRLKELNQLKKEGITQVWGWHSDTQLKDGYTSQFDFYIRKNSKGEDELVSLQSSINPYKTQGKPVQNNLQNIEDSINDQLYHFLSTSKVIKKLNQEYQNDSSLVCLLNKADFLLK